MVMTETKSPAEKLAIELWFGTDLRGPLCVEKDV